MKNKKKVFYLFFCSLLLVFLLFSIFFIYGKPVPEDYIFLNRAQSMSYLEIFTSTLSNTFNIYDSPLTSRTDIYRPFFESTFKTDYLLLHFLHIDFFKISNFLFFLIPTFIFSLFVLHETDFKHALIALALLILHTCHTEAQYTLCNRIDAMVGMFIFIIMSLFYSYFIKKSTIKLVMIYFLFILFMLTKETVVITFLTPVLSFLLFVVIKDHDLKTQITQKWRTISLHTSIFLALIIFYLYVRTLMFTGENEYMPVSSWKGIIFNMIVSIKQMVGFKGIYTIFAIPILIYFGYCFRRNRNKISLVLIFILMVGIVGPSLIYYPAKRFVFSSALLFIFLFTFFLKDIKRIYLKVLIICSLAIPLTIQSFEIKSKQLSAFAAKMVIVEQLEKLETDKNTVAVILPHSINDEGLFFDNGIPQFLNNLVNFENKRIIVLGTIYRMNSSYTPVVTKNHSKVFLKYPSGAEFGIPQLHPTVLEFDNRYFYVKHLEKSNEVIYDLKIQDFNVLYFEKLSPTEYSFKVI